eukprot:COSAG02_NODE_304_length_25204_cov_11.025095_10_plen_59_part_00
MIDLSHTRQASGADVLRGCASQEQTVAAAAADAAAADADDSDDEFADVKGQSSCLLAT